MLKKQKANPIEINFRRQDLQSRGHSKVIPFAVRRAMLNNDWLNHIAVSGEIEYMFRRPRQIFLAPRQKYVSGADFSTVENLPPYKQ